MSSKILQIRNLDGKTAYNPTIPFKDGEKTYIGVRLESFDSELDSKIHFAHKLPDGSWEIDNTLPTFALQDPAHMQINGKLILSGVKVQNKGKNTLWNQEFYRGDSIRTLKHFASGPMGMKDIRLVNLENKIGVFTRPQGEIGGLGKIGYLEIESIDDLAKLTKTEWYNAPIIENLFEEGTWGGANQAIALANGELGVFGHKAYAKTYKNELMKKYYAIAFKFNPKNHSISNLKTIATRKDFPNTLSKRSPELNNVIFPSGVDKKYNLYCGLSDYSIGTKEIKNPF